MWITSLLSTVKTPTCIALGNFDGVHRGHQRVIEPVLTDAVIRPAALESRSSHQLSYSTVVTFQPHPREFFTGERRSLLTPLEEKIVVLRSLGVKQLVLLPFNEAVAKLAPEEFVRSILVEQLQAKHISVGKDFCFGRNRSGTATDLRAIATQYEIPVEIVPLHTCDGERISSSAIREALSLGDLERANRLLGRPYQLVGRVVHGQQLGRTIGFPTANLKLPAEKFVPRTGVYSVWVSCPTMNSGQAVRGVMNIGYRPTVEGKQQTIEVHILDWSGDLYGQTLNVMLDGFLRPEQKFASLDELKAQIQEDCAAAQTTLAAVNRLG